MSHWKRLNREIVACDLCPRLRQHCREIATVKRRAFAEQTYWGRPVPNFGDPDARLLIVGLAPAAHGANRTGRMFTGDRSGQWLYRALHKADFANQSQCDAADDGPELSDCAITAACHCAPPENKPTRQEIAACRPWLQKTFRILPVRVILALGQIAWKVCVQHAVTSGWHTGRRPKFAHGAKIPLTEDRWLLGSYHPSQQNTFTGRLTKQMFDSVFREARKLVGSR